jgi:hypothetical protein
MKLSTIAAVAIVATVVTVRATIEAAGILAALIGVLIGLESLESLESQTETIEPPVLMALPDANLTVIQLRTLARRRLGSAARISGRRIAQANRAQLLAALGAA